MCALKRSSLCQSCVQIGHHLGHFEKTNILPIQDKDQIGHNFDTTRANLDTMPGVGYPSPPGNRCLERKLHFARTVGGSDRFHCLSRQTVEGAGPFFTTQERLREKARHEASCYGACLRVASGAGGSRCSPAKRSGDCWDGFQV